MTLSDLAVRFVYPLVVGIALGLFYYGSLWLILRNLSKLKHPALVLGVSLPVRTFIVVLVCYLLFVDSWQQLLITVLGMLITRTLMIQWIKPGPHDVGKEMRRVP